MTEKEALNNLEKEYEDLYDLYQKEMSASKDLTEETSSEDLEEEMYRVMRCAFIADTLEHISDKINTLRSHIESEIL